MRVVVLTVDQRGSTRGSDKVPAILERLGAAGLFRPFERTAGDEFQGVLTDPTALAPVLERLLREGGWSIGVGVGEVEEPLPASTRAGRGSAYLRARDAVTSAKTAVWHLRVAGDRPAARDLETALWLWAALLARRTARGWEVADLVDTGLRYDEVAARLGVTPSAISQRATAAGIIEGLRARELVTGIVGGLLQDEDLDDQHEESTGP